MWYLYLFIINLVNARSCYVVNLTNINNKDSVLLPVQEALFPENRRNEKALMVTQNNQYVLIGEFLLYNTVFFLVKFVPSITHGSFVMSDVFLKLNFSFFHPLWHWSVKHISMQYTFLYKKMSSSFKLGIAQICAPLKDKRRSLKTRPIFRWLSPFS